MQVAAKFKVDIEWPMNDLCDYASLTPDVSKIYPNLITPWSDYVCTLHTQGFTHRKPTGEIPSQKTKGEIGLKYMWIHVSMTHNRQKHGRSWGI
jgi:hypothetical protein